MTVTMSNESIAKIVYEANRMLCEAIGDHSQSDWEDAAEWQKASVLDGVEFHQKHPLASASGSHDNWMKVRLADGWTYGPIKLTEEKRHPCLVPFGELPIEQQVKDVLFGSIVSSLAAISR